MKLRAWPPNSWWLGACPPRVNLVERYRDGQFGSLRFSVLGSMETFRWGRGKSTQAKQAMCHQDAQQRAGCPSAHEEESVFIFGVDSASHQPAGPGSARSRALPACLEHPWRPRCVFPPPASALSPSAEGADGQALARLGAGTQPPSTYGIADLAMCKVPSPGGGWGCVRGEGRRGGGTGVPKLGCDHETRLPPRAGFGPAKYLLGGASCCLPHGARAGWMGLA